MKICLIGTEIGPSREGAIVRGHVNNIISLSREFESMGHTVHIITNIPKFSHSSYYEKWLNWAYISHFPIASTSLSAMGLEFAIKALNKIISIKSPSNNVHTAFAIYSYAKSIIGAICRTIK